MDQSIDTIFTLFFEFGQNSLEVLSTNNHNVKDLPFKLFPNPGAENGFYLEGENLIKGKVKVINQMGQIVHYQTVDLPHVKAHIQTPVNIPTGMYTVVLSAETGRISSLKWIKL